MTISNYTSNIPIPNFTLHISLFLIPAYGCPFWGGACATFRFLPLSLPKDPPKAGKTMLAKKIRVLMKSGQRKNCYMNGFYHSPLPNHFGSCVFFFHSDAFSLSPKKSRQFHHTPNGDLRETLDV